MITMVVHGREELAAAIACVDCTERVTIRLERKSGNTFYHFNFTDHVEPSKRIDLYLESITNRVLRTAQAAFE